MDRKGILGIVLAITALVCWQLYYTRETGKALREHQEKMAAAAAAATPAPATPAPDARTAPAASAAPAPAVSETAAAEQIEKISTPSVEYSFTNLGGGISRALLVQHHAENDAKVVLNEFGKIPIGAVSESAGEGTSQPFTILGNPQAGEITFQRMDARQLETTKKFILPQPDAEETKKGKLREEYLVEMELTFANRGSQPLQVPSYFVHAGSASPVYDGDMPIYTGFNFFRGSGNKFIDVNWFSGGGFLFFSKPERPVFQEPHDQVRWSGVTNQYFTSLVTPAVDDKADTDVQARQRGVSVWARRFHVSDEAWKAAGHSGAGSGERFGVDGAIGMPGLTLAAGESKSQSFNLYIGPREYRRLKMLGNYEHEVMDFGIFGIVSKTLLNAMNLFRSWFNSYAWAIVVLTLVIKTLMWPLQNKATNSMKKMQLLQPKMTELREKYKDDPTRMNTELMRLYKEYNINPMSGCIPLLIQIPIFFGFYNMLGKAVELRNSKFFWVDDLSQPDTVAHLLGIPINPLPLLMAATMFWQMAISPKSGDPVQQRVFMFMPLIFIFFCYNFASALALYWTVQNLFSIVQLYVTRNQAAPELQKAAPANKKPRA